MDEHKMPAGTYWIGDLCYVLDLENDEVNEWDEVCSHIIDLVTHTCLEGKFQMKDGREFICFSTKYGDGEYPCSNGSRLGVDAGLIGCIKLSDIKAEHTTKELAYLGTTVDFPNEFWCYSDNGDMTFGHITVNTSGSGGGYEEDEEEYEND